MAEKILVVVPSLRRGGAERTVALMAKAWAAKREVVVAVFDARDQAFPIAEPVRTVDLDCPASASSFTKTVNAITRIRRLASLIRREQPRRIISFMESANFPAIVACRVTGHAQDLTISVRNNPSSFPAAYRRLIPLLYRWPRRIVTGSQGVRRGLIDGFRVPADKCIAIANPIDPAAIWQATSATTEFELPSSPFILAAGRFVRQKGFDLLIEAFATATAQSDHVLMILGEGPERDALNKLARDLGVDDRLMMPGSAVTPAPYMNAARCFVLSSRHEGWPNVVMEAMACRCPVVAFDCDYGPSEILEDEKSGILVSAGDHEALGQAIDRILCNDGLRQRIGDAGRERVSAFRTDVVAGRWLEE